MIHVEDHAAHCRMAKEIIICRAMGQLKTTIKLNTVHHPLSTNHVAYKFTAVENIILPEFISTVKVLECSCVALNMFSYRYIWYNCMGNSWRTQPRVLCYGHPRSLKNEDLRKQRLEHERNRQHQPTRREHIILISFLYQFLPDWQLDRHKTEHLTTSSR